MSYRLVRLEKGGPQIHEHVAVAEKALGKPLPPKAVVHHVNGNGRDNRGENLVVCENQGYHNLLHARLRALLATGDPRKRKCVFCKRYDDLSAFVADAPRHYHRACKSASNRHYGKTRAPR